jgi:hypothetical protein
MKKGRMIENYKFEVNSLAGTSSTFIKGMAIK